MPEEPIVFTKSPNTLIGPNDDVLIPEAPPRPTGRLSSRSSSAGGAYLESPAEAASVIAGYSVANDVSERAFQMERGGQWCKGKSAATFNPMGPWLVTPDEIPDVNALGMWLDVNERRRQTGSTATMIFDPLTIVHYLTQFFVLEPGDVINTGTPPGSAWGTSLRSSSRLTT